MLGGCREPSTAAIRVCEKYGDSGLSYEGMHLGSRDFSVPRGTYLCLGLDDPYPVFIVSGRRRIDLGVLTYQFGDMPFKTIILQLSPTYHVITGLLDDDVSGPHLTVTFTHGGIGIEIAKTTKPSIYGMLWIPIHELNFPNWETIERAYISINWGDTIIREEDFDPKIDVLKLAVPVIYQ